MIHQVVRFGFGDHHGNGELECECGWIRVESNAIALFEEWHEHRMTTEDDEKEDHDS